MGRPAAAVEAAAVRRFGAAETGRADDSSGPEDDGPAGAALISSAPPAPSARRSKESGTDLMASFATTRFRAGAWRVLLTPLLSLGGCSHEHATVGEPQMMVGRPDRAMVGLHKIRGAGADLGYMETWTVGPEETRKLYRVTDLKRTPLGYVDDSGRAYRYTAHDGVQLAAQTDDLGRNVRAVMDLRDVERFELVDQVPARAR